jgi:NAD(P) transhydrogenase subunit beta
VSAASIAAAAYLVAALLFILSLAGLSKHESARQGWAYGVAGMVVALAATIGLTLHDSPKVGVTTLILGVALVIGGSVGLWQARIVQMTGMPELIALLHSFVGLAAVLVGWASYVEVERMGQGGFGGSLLKIHHAEVFIGIFIGAVTFTGSIVANLKLRGTLKSAPLVLPGKHVLNLLALLAFAGLTVHFVISPDLWSIIVVTVIALLFGWHLVASIGGGDMPVVVSMLNSYSGWAAAASGFLLNNDLLIVTGALVGSSGAYLSYIMCKAMNRSFISVIALHMM